MQRNAQTRRSCHLAIVGTGAVGLAIGAALQRQGMDVGMVGRQGPMTWRATLASAGGAPRPYEFPAAEWRRCDLVFVTVKAFDLELALSSLGALPAGAAVVVVGNGAIDELVAAAAHSHPQWRWRLGVATIGVSATGPQAFELRSTTGQIGMGAWPKGGSAEHWQRTPLEADLVATSDLLTWDDDIWSRYRLKWLFNTVINTLCAARGLAANAQLLTDASAMRQVYAEALALGTSLWGPWPKTAEVMYAEMLALIDRTGANENSMARDRRLKRRTESAFLAGLAKDANLYPNLVALHAQISS